MLLTQDADESVMSLTPEQQKQLAMIEKMPYIVEKGSSPVLPDEQHRVAAAAAGQSRARARTGSTCIYMY